MVTKISTTLPVYQRAVSKKQLGETVLLSKSNHPKYIPPLYAYWILTMISPYIPGGWDPVLPSIILLSLFSMVLLVILAHVLWKKRWFSLITKRAICGAPEKQDSASTYWSRKFLKRLNISRITVASIHFPILRSQSIYCRWFQKR